MSKYSESVCSTGRSANIPSLDQTGLTSLDGMLPMPSRGGWSHRRNCHRQPRHNDSTLAVRMDVEAPPQFPNPFSHPTHSNPTRTTRAYLNFFSLPYPL